MTPADRMAHMLRAAHIQYDATLSAIQSLHELGLMIEAQVESDLASAKEALDWNIGQAEMDFALDTGVTHEPSRTVRGGFAGDNGSATNANG